jgi:hypothetical protein
MGLIVEGSKVARDDNARKQDVTVGMSQLAFEALMGEEADAVGQVTVRMESALRCYLGDKDTERPAWPYPGFLRGSEAQGDIRVQAEVEERLWREFEEEASAQGISVDQLAEHAAFYFAAELDAGRLTERILEDLESTKGE